MLSTLTFIMVACLFADLAVEKGQMVLDFIKSKL